MTTRAVVVLLSIILGGTACDELWVDDVPPVDLLWEVRVPADQVVALTHPAAWDGGVAFGLAGQVIAYAPRTGERLWAADVGAPIPLNLVFRDGDVYGAGTEAYALNAGSGAIHWSEPLTNGNGSGGRSATSELFFFVADRGGDVVAFHRATGARAWEASFASDSVPATAVNGVYEEDGTLYVAVEHVLALGGRRGLVAALRSDTGERLWMTALPPGHADRSTAGDAPILAHGLVIVSDTYSNALLALSAATGEIAWRWEGPAGWVGPFEAPALRDRTLYLGSGDTHVYAIDALTGDTRWSRKLDNSVNQVAICGEFVLADRATLEILRLDSGAPVQLLFDDEDEFVVGGITVHDDVAYLATYGRLVALDCG